MTENAPERAQRGAEIEESGSGSRTESGTSRILVGGWTPLRSRPVQGIPMRFRRDTTSRLPPGKGRVASRPDPELDRLWREHRRFAAAIALAHLDAAADLDDVLQEVAMAFVNGVRELRDPAALRPWLRTVVVNAARSDHRRRAVRRNVESVPFDLALEVEDGRRPGVSADAEQAEALRALVDALRLLPDELREPLLLRGVDGFGQREIAEILGIPETTVETRIARARRFLRERAGRVLLQDGDHR